MERTNARLLAPNSVTAEPVPTLLVMDVSFISATLLLGPVFAAAPSLAEAVILVKPQSRPAANTSARAASCAIPRRTNSPSDRVADGVRSVGWQVVRTIPSPIHRAEGNHEFLLYAAGLPPLNRSQPQSVTLDRMGSRRHSLQPNKEELTGFCPTSSTGCASTAFEPLLDLEAELHHQRRGVDRGEMPPQKPNWSRSRWRRNLLAADA